jgi:hypothetical protein
LLCGFFVSINSQYAGNIAFCKVTLIYTPSYVMPFTAYYTQLLQVHTLLPCSYISSKIMMLGLFQVNVEASHNDLVHVLL